MSIIGEKTFTPPEEIEWNKRKTVDKVSHMSDIYKIPYFSMKILPKEIWTDPELVAFHQNMMDDDFLKRPTIDKVVEFYTQFLEKYRVE